MHHTPVTAPNAWSGATSNAASANPSTRPSPIAAGRVVLPDAHWRRGRSRDQSVPKARAVNLRRPPKIVLLGMMSKMPVAGVVWQTVHYLVGFERLGYEAYYVEAHARTPTMFMEKDGGSTTHAAAFIAGVMKRFDLGDRWAFQALHDDGRCCGLSERQLSSLYRSADLVINLHGGTKPRPEHYANGRLVYLETDPVELQIQLYRQEQEIIDFLAPHCAFFTFGENIGHADCGVPVPERFAFKATRQPVVVDFWQGTATESGAAFTTIGNWRQQWRSIRFKGEDYSWSKHHEFLKVLDLPRRVDQPFELALSSYSESDQRLLEGHGWRVRHARDVSTDPDAYRDYIMGSRGEFTVAKDQNVRLRSGWFSDRSATYLAAGRPVITQETGFSAVISVGAGLFGYSTMDQIVEAVECINADYDRHCQAARKIAREYFNYDVVLSRLLDEVGL